jgi:tetratricopeptide (TPR) repeat protein
MSLGSPKVCEQSWRQMASSAYNKAIELNPDDAYAYDERSYLNYTKGDFDDAMADYNKAIALDPDDAYAIKGRDYLMTKKIIFARRAPIPTKLALMVGKSFPIDKR